MEKWKDVAGYEGVYSVSDLGRVRRDLKAKGTKPGRIMKPWKSRDGYSLVTLYNNDRRWDIAVHTLVSRAFLGTKPEGYDVDHVDNDKNNNALSNLSFLEHDKNVKKAFDSGGRIPVFGDRHGMSKTCKDEVVAIRTMFNSGKYTFVDIGKKFGMTPENVSSIIRRLTWKHVK